MVAVSHRLCVAYYPIPKVACTSLKRLLYELDSGHDPDALRDRQGQPLTIHNIYGSNPDGGRWSRVAQAYWSFVVVRDPIDRFVSGYRNRILHHRDLEREGSRKLRGAGLPWVPDFDRFVRSFALYFRLSKAVKHHFRPQKDFVGRVLTRVNRIYRIEELDELVKDLERITGTPVRLPRLQTGGGNVAVDVADWHRRWIREYMRADYAMLARVGLADPPAPPGSYGLTPRLLRRAGGI
jgi:hypothetical protein